MYKMSIIQKKNKSQKWCEAGSSHVWLRNDNTASVCCALKKANKFPLDDHSNFQKVMQSPQWKKFIQPLENGPISDNQCHQCISQEQQTGESQRTKLNQTSTNKFFLKIDFSNKCNLKCVMCSSARSTGWIKDEQKMIELGYIDVDNSSYQKLADKWWLNNEKEWWDNVDKIEISGGEPFYEPMLFEFFNFLLSIGKQDVSLSIITNLTLYNKEIDEILNKFSNIMLLCSVDAWQEDVYQYARGGIYTLETIKQNIKNLSNTVSRLCIVDTVHCITYDQGPIGKQWIEDQKFKNVDHYQNFVYTPRHLDVRSIVPDNLLQINNLIKIPKNGYKKDKGLQVKFYNWVNMLDKVRGLNILKIRPEFTDWFKELREDAETR